ncbi:Protoheme IX farnesyltransferase, mitochondrial [Coelomomyces lativittatus]|nr:Protoheme IX farnesyltransferase, mitochondrial [Coelomomyces lativittatus]
MNLSPTSVLHSIWRRPSCQWETPFHRSITTWFKKENAFSISSASTLLYFKNKRPPHSELNGSSQFPPSFTFSSSVKKVRVSFRNFVLQPYRLFQQPSNHRTYASAILEPKISTSTSFFFPNSSSSSSIHPTVSTHCFNSKWNALESFFFTQISWDSTPASSTSSTHLVSSTKASSSVLATCREWTQTYLALSKARLASLVTLTSMVGYAVAPTTTSSLSILLGTTVGTGLCVASANTWNQLMESPYDAQMPRTRHRPLVRHALGPWHTTVFGLTTGCMGISVLGYCVNPLTASLGALNIVVYALVYTPMKRTTSWNTWIGAVVGAIPPMMGWAACTGSLWIPQDLGAYVLGFLLYAWQFPHFNALSWPLRSEYAKAGYTMLAVTHPDLNARVALRYSLALVFFPFLTTYLQLTTPAFILTSSLVNGLMVYHAFQFWRTKSNQNARDFSALGLF